MLKKTISILAILVAGAVEATAWKGLNDAGWYSGKKLTADQLEGKVVLVDCWGAGCPPCRAALPRIQEIWMKFRSKPFILVGSHCQGRQPERVRELIEQNKLTYPVYDYFGLAEGEPSFRGIPFIYVVDHRGKVCYSGHDDAAAVKAVEQALAAIGAPPNLAAGVNLEKYRMFEKKLFLGNNLKSIISTLKKDVKAAERKSASAVQIEKAAEAKAILDAIEAGRAEVRSEIERLQAAKPDEAKKLIKLFISSFPEEATNYQSTRK